MKFSPGDHAYKLFTGYAVENLLVVSDELQFVVVGRESFPTEMRQAKARRTLDSLATIDQLRSNSINRDVHGPAPRVELSGANRRSQGRIALSD